MAPYYPQGAMRRQHSGNTLPHHCRIASAQWQQRRCTWVAGIRASAGWAGWPGVQQQRGKPNAESHLGMELMGAVVSIARLSMERCLPSDAMASARDSAFVCATASSCTRSLVTWRHLLIVSELMSRDCLAEVHESRSWTVVLSTSSSSASAGSVAGRFRDMRHRDRLREGREGSAAHEVSPTGEIS